MRPRAASPRSHHQAIDLLGRGISSAPRPQQRRTFLVAEREVGGGQLGQPARRARLRDAQLQRPPARDSDVQRVQLGPDQLAQQPQRAIRPLEMLRVVDHQDERARPAAGRVGQQLSCGRERVDRLRRERELLGQRVRGTRDRARDRVEHRLKRTSGARSVSEQLIQATGAGRPRPGPDRGRRLAVAGARRDQHPARRQSFGHPGGEPVCVEICHPVSPQGRGSVRLSRRRPMITRESACPPWNWATARAAR